MNNLLICCKIFLKEVLINKINIIVFLIALLIFMFSIHRQIEENKYVRDWKGKITLKTNIVSDIQEYSRKIILYLTIYLFICCLLNNLTSFFASNDCVDSRKKILSLGCSDLCLLFVFLCSSIILYNIFMLPYWIFMFYFSCGSIYFNYVFGIIFFYNMFVVKALLVLMIFVFNINFNNLNKISIFYRFLLFLISYCLITQFLKEYLANLNFYFNIFNLMYSNYIDVTFFMSPVINYPYEPKGQIRSYYYVTHFIKYIFIVFIPMIVISGYYALKSIKTNKTLILNIDEGHK